MELNRMIDHTILKADASKEAVMQIIEEAKKRDHRKLGSELKLFTFDEQIGVAYQYGLVMGLDFVQN